MLARESLVPGWGPTFGDGPSRLAPQAVWVVRRSAVLLLSARSLGFLVDELMN